MFVVGDIIRNNAIQYPEKIGLVHGDQRFKWRETDDRVNSLAQALVKQGLNRGDGVGLLLRNCHQWVETALSIAKTGLRMIPLNLMLQAEELTYIINDSEAKALVVDADKTEMVNGMLGDLPRVETVIGIAPPPRLRKAGTP